MQYFFKFLQLMQFTLYELVLVDHVETTFLGDVKARRVTHYSHPSRSLWQNGHLKPTRMTLHCI